MFDDETQDAGGEDEFGSRVSAELIEAAWLVEAPVQYVVESERRRLRTAKEYLTEAYRARAIAAAAYARAHVRLEVMHGSGRFTAEEVAYAKTLVDEVGLILWDAEEDYGVAREAYDEERRAEARSRADREAADRRRKGNAAWLDDGNYLFRPRWGEG